MVAHLAHDISDPASLSQVSLSRLSHTARFKLSSDKAMVELEKRMDELKVAIDDRDDLQAKQDLLGRLHARA